VNQYTDFDRQPLTAGHREPFAPLMTLARKVESLGLRRIEGLSCRRRPASIFAPAARSKKSWIPASVQVAGQALRRNDDMKSRLPVDEFTISRLYVEGHSVTGPDRADWRWLVVETDGK